VCTVHNFRRQAISACNTINTAMTQRTVCIMSPVCQFLRRQPSLSDKTVRQRTVHGVAHCLRYCLSL
jgi:hypothetical protein